MPLLPPYTTGTATVAVGGTTVTVTGILSDINAREGDWLRDPATGYTTAILARVDATHVTVDAWRGAAITAAGYEIYPYSPLRFVGGTAMADVQALFAIINGATIFYQVTGSAPDNSLGEDGNMAIKVNAAPWQQWLKSGGVWVSQGTPIGIANKGAWSSVTAYAVNDVVGSAGSAYLCIAPNTNQVPPNATYWALIGAAGVAGTNGTAMRGGTGAPSGGLGADGDHYFRTDTFDVYIKAAGVWTIEANVKGATGATPVISGTSTSVVTVGTGSKTFATQAGIAWAAGMRLRAINAGLDRVVVGIATIYSGSTLVIYADFFQGVGADNNWTITIVGERGQDGGSGPAGAASSVPGPTGPASTVAGPQGVQGATGTGIQPDATGTLAQRATYDNQVTGYKFLETDVSPFKLWIKASNTTADWAGPTFIGGAAAVGDLGSVADSVLQIFDYGVAA